MARPRMSKEEVNDKKQQFGMWLGLPKDVREPKTQEELAKTLDTTEQTLCAWAKDPIVKAAKDGAIKLLGGNDMYEVTKSLTGKAKSGSFQHQRLYLEWQGQIGNKETKGKSEPIEFKVSYGKK